MQGQLLVIPNLANSQREEMPPRFLGVLCGVPAGQLEKNPQCHQECAAPQKDADREKDGARIDGGHRSNMNAKRRQIPLIL